MSESCLDIIATSAVLFRLDAGVDFFAVYTDLFWRADAKSDLGTFNAEHGDANLGADPYGFIDATGQYQHAIPLKWSSEIHRQRRSKWEIASQPKELEVAGESRKKRRATWRCPIVESTC
jgi:hypothetical protein